VIVPIHPREGREFHRPERAPRSLPTDHFRFEKPDDRFGEGVVVAVAATADDGSMPASATATGQRLPKQGPKAECRNPPSLASIGGSLCGTASGENSGHSEGSSVRVRAKSINHPDRHPADSGRRLLQSDDRAAGGDGRVDRATAHTSLAAAAQAPVELGSSHLVKASPHMADESNRVDREQGVLPGFNPGGPYLAVALLCEKVLKEADGVTSLIRIIDRVTVSVSGPGAPVEMPAAPVNLTLVVGFKSGFARGPYSVRVKALAPSGRVLSTIELPMLLEGEDRGTQVAMTLNFQAEEEGLYWFEVFVLEALITKVPLRVVYQRLSMS
jgi:uncharacterized protein DUF6941